MLEINKAKGHRVEVLDTLSNETTSYNSIKEAGRAIGCSDTTISNALKRLQKEGVKKLIKNKYLVKL